MASEELKDGSEAKLPMRGDSVTSTSVLACLFFFRCLGIDGWVGWTYWNHWHQDT
jgi:hypothetical protein